jgi:hypothetical protein
MRRLAEGDKIMNWLARALGLMVLVVVLASPRAAYACPS